MQCPKCSQTVPDGSATCPNCGTSLTPASGDGFFNLPGDVLTGEPIVPSSTPAPAPAPEPAPAAPAPTAGPRHCTSCGAVLPDYVKFCTACGATVPTVTDEAASRLSGSGIRINMGKTHSAGSAPNPGVPANDTYTPDPGYPSREYTPVETVPTPAPRVRPTLPYLREVCASPLYLTAIIFYTLVTGLSLYTGLTTFLPLMGDGGLPVIFALLYVVVPPFLAMIGLWLLFGGARGSGQGLATGGLITLSVTSIIALLMQVVFLVGLAMLTVGSALGDDPIYDKLPEKAQELLDSYLVIVLVMFVLMVIPTIIYWAKLLGENMGTAIALRKGTVPPVPSDYVSVAVTLTGVGFLAALFLVMFPLQDIIEQLNELAADIANVEEILPITTLLSLALTGICNIFLGAVSCIARVHWRRHMIR